MTGLAATQRRFHDAVTGRTSLADARTLVRDDGVDPIDRLRVYAHAYFVRIRDALAAEYPKLAAVLGDAGFTALVSRYLEAHPTRHPSLRDAGITLPRYLSEDDGWRVGPSGHADLARLERARTEVFDGADATPLSGTDLAALRPEEFPSLRLTLVPSSAVVPLATNADDVWSAIEDGVPVPPIEETPRVVLVWRRDLVVIHRRLADDEARAIERVARGATFAEVCGTFIDRPNPAERVLALVGAWLDAGVLA